MAKEIGCSPHENAARYPQGPTEAQRQDIEQFSATKHVIHQYPHTRKVSGVFPYVVSHEPFAATYGGHSEMPLFAALFPPHFVDSDDFSGDVSEMTQ
ncbi:hypothetical protein [uncultured Ruegeria sp.]|uniref:hypothetical protein n=1 Tax=uncultured Ruegeria sp. TaxID=259304 RepID=UPI00260B5040|nr:hypothetical protein [uncultured Ruegeria sp.]